MNIKPSSAEVKALATLLDQGEFGSAVEMAKAALEMAFTAYESRANWIIVGQLHYGPRQGYARSNGDRVAFGPYATLGDATAAGEQLSYSGATHEEFRWWLLPYHQGTPAQWFRHRKAVHEQAEEVPLTNAEKLIIRYHPDDSWKWGLDPTGGPNGKGGRLQHKKDDGRESVAA